MNKKKILAILATPPPVHGSNIMNLYVKNSKVINSEHDLSFINYNFTKNVSDIGKNSLGKFVQFFYLICKLIYTLISKRIDLVYFPIVPFGNAFYRDSLIVLILKIFKRKIIFHLHGKGVSENYKKSKIIYDFVFNNSSIICLSSFLTYDIKNFSSKVYILNNGIEESSNTIKKEKSNKVRILYLSNFIKEKGVLDLLDSISLIKDKNLINFEVNLVGNFTDEISKEFLSRFINDLNISEYVNIIGPKYGSEKFEILCNSDVFIFPTYYPNETFPLSLIEACQFSLPIISTYEGAIPDLVEDNFNGYLVNQRDVKHLSKKIVELISNREQLDLFSINSRKKYETKYKIEIFENNLNEILKQNLFK